MKKTAGATLTGALLMALAGSTAPIAQEKGGIIDVSIIGEPPTLDPRVTTTHSVGAITQHMLETLYTFDAEKRVVPLLAADMPRISDDGLVYDIPLRQGIKFHDGTDMDSEDVVASLKTWLEIATRGKLVAGQMENIEAIDSHNVRITLSRPSGALLSLLSLPISAAVILPAEKQANPMNEPVGTGPYVLKEHRPDQYIQVVRFEDYVSPEGKSSGYGGERKQYLDEIRFVPVPDANTRIEGSIAGQYHFADSLPIESLSRLESVDSVDPIVQSPGGWAVFILNKRQGISANTKIAKAVSAALNMEDMMTAAFGDKQYWTLNGALYQPNDPYYTEAGVEGNYNLGDTELAAQLLKEGGYDGEPLRILTSRQYEFHYKLAQVAAEYLKAAGFNVDLQVLEWATLSERRQNPEVWEIFITHGLLMPEPSLIGPLSPTDSTGWDTEARAKVMDPFMTEADPKTRTQLWAAVQEVIYEEVPFIKIGDFNGLAAKAPELHDVNANIWPSFWNAWLEK